MGLVVVVVVVVVVMVGVRKLKVKHVASAMVLGAFLPLVEERLRVRRRRRRRRELVDGSVVPWRQHCRRRGRGRLGL